MKIRRLLLALFAFAGSAAAQFTTVTGTVIDPNTLPYSFGSINAILVLPGGQSPTLNGAPYSPPTQPAGLDGNGKFTLQLADNNVLLPANTTWNFSVCSQLGATVQPAFGKGSVCFVLPTPITITGSSQDISVQLQAAALPLTVPFSSSGGLTCTPATAFTILTFNSTANCTSGLNLAYGFYTLPSGGAATNIVAAGGGSTRTANGGFQAMGTTSGNFGSFFTTNAAGSQFIFGANVGFSPASWKADSSLSPINYAQLSFAGAWGFEFSGGGDAQGSGTAAGFKVTNAASTLNNSPGAPNSLTAGNSNGSTNSTSPGGDTTITSGNYLGANNNRGGDVTITSGNSSGTGRGGNINLNTGTGATPGQVLCNGNPCFQGTLAAPTITTCSGCPITFGNTETVIISKAVTFPATGCPCRVLVSYALFLSTGNSGQDAALVCDIATAPCTGNAMATSQTATTGSASAYGINGTGFSPVTYANNATVTFTVQAASTHAGSTTAVASVTPALTGAQSSNLNIAVLGSQ
jgi:hypothetical protein